MATAVKTKLADVVKETTATTGTGTLSLAGAVTGFRTFIAALGDGSFTFYAVSDGTNWEVGFGKVYDSTGHKLDRDEVFASSNAGSAVDWAAGTKAVRCVDAAELASNAIKLKHSAQTTDATQTVLTIFGISGYEVSVPSGSTIAIHATIVARQTAGGTGTVGDSYTGKLVALVENTSGTVTLIGSPAVITGSTYNSAALSVSVTAAANDTDDTIQIKVTGEVDKTIEWNAFVEIFEVS